MRTHVPRGAAIWQTRSPSTRSNVCVHAPLQVKVNKYPLKLIYQALPERIPFY